MVKKKIEYDEEREKRWVENYYKIKNTIKKGMFLIKME